MICLRIKGRMGNQLFQMAFAKYMESVTGDSIVIDWSEVKERHKESGDGWENSFLGSCTETVSEISTEQVCSAIQDKVLTICKYVTYHRYLKHLLPLAKFIAQFFGVYTCLDNRYFRYTYFGKKNKLIYGYFESDRYFSSVEGKLRKMYQKKDKTSNSELYRKICSTESVCVTVRRGDFYTKENQENLGVCNEEYFQRGIQYIKSAHKNATVFFFSDDINWVKNNIKVEGPAYYESGEDSLWEKMLLMSSCKHFVISNSTFSWWAQYLSKNENKIVVAPSQWRADDKRYEIKQNNWVIL